MDYIFDNKTPIYMQLVDKIRLNIVSGKLKKGERLLSVRELALEFKVNPNTMQKALVELEQEGLIYTQRTSGKFVTENENVIRDAKCTLAMNKAKTFMQDMESIGIKNLYKSFGEHEVLKNINLTVQSGKIVGLLGKNGTGKTTLIKLINDLLTKDKRRNFS